MRRLSYPYKTDRTARRVVLAAVALCLSVSVVDARVFRWTSPTGQVYYSDQVPADQGTMTREEISPSGQVKKTVTARPTPEEQKAKQEAADDAHVKTQVERDQQQHDMVLLKTFGSVDELELAKRQRIEQIDSKILAAKDQVASLESRIADLESKVAQADPRLPKNYKDEAAALGKAVAVARVAVDRGYEERNQVEAGFNADLVRLRELRSPAETR